MREFCRVGWLVMLMLTCGTALAAGDAPRMLPRQGLNNATPLIIAGQPTAVIIYPAVDAAYRDLAERVSAAADAAGGARLHMVAADEVLEETLFLPEELARQHVILLGNLQHNRALAQFAARYQAYATTEWPGPRGYVVRTIVNPLGTKANVLVLGGSDVAGVTRAVERFVEIIAAVAQPGQIVIPRQLEVVIDGRPQANAAPKKTRYATQMSGAYQFAEVVEQYLTTGSQARLERVRELLAAYLADHRAPTHHDYGTEAGIRALDQVDTYALSDEENLVMDNLVLDWVLKIIKEKPYWNPQGKRWSFGAHQAAGTMSFYAAINYLLESGQPNAAARELLTAQRRATRAFLNFFSTSFKDKQKDVGWETWHPLSFLPRYALAERDLTYFHSGTVQRVIQRQFYGGHNTSVAAVAAYVLRDGRYIPLAPEGATLNGWAFPARGARWRASDDVSPQPPDFLLGTQTLPTNEIEWQIARNRAKQADKSWFTERPHDETFHAIGFAGGVGPNDTLAVLGGWDSAGAPGEANTLRILRQGGHAFLHRADGEDQRRPRPGRLYQNSLLVASTAPQQRVDSAARLVALHNGEGLGHSVTELADFHGVDWGRQVFWRRGGYFVVLDTAQVRQAGPITLVSQWWSPDRPAFHGDRWTAPTGQGTFNVIAGDPSLAQTEQLWGGGPYRLQQRRHQQAEAGERISFVSVLYVDSAEAGQHIEMRRLDPQAVLLRRTRPSGDDDGVELALISAGACDFGRLRIDGQGGYVSPSIVHVVGDGSIRLDGRAIAATERAAAEDAQQLNAALAQLWDAHEEAAVTPPAIVTVQDAMQQRTKIGLRGEGVAVAPVAFEAHRDGSTTWRFAQPIRLSAIEGIRRDGETVTLEVWPDKAAAEPTGLLAPVTMRNEWVDYQYGFAARLGVQVFGPIDTSAVAVRTPGGVGDPPFGRWIAESWHKQPWNVRGHNPELFDRPFWQDVVFRDDQHRVGYVATQAADLGDGLAWIGATELGELFVLNADGTPRWTRQLEAPVRDLLVADLTGDRRNDLVVTLRDSTVRVLDADGQSLFTLNTITDETPAPILLAAPQATAVVELSDGRRGLAVATYHQARLYDAAGGFITSTEASGFYLGQIAPLPNVAAGTDQAIVLRDNVRGMVSVVDLETFKPLALRSTLAGRGLGLKVWPGTESTAARFLSVSESGVAMLEWRGQRGSSTGGSAELIEGGLEQRFVLPIEAVRSWCVIEQGPDSAPHIAVATALGEVMVLDASSRVVAKTVVATHIHDIAKLHAANGVALLVFATDRGLLILDERLNRINELPSAKRCTALQAAGADDDRLLCLFDDGSAVVLRGRELLATGAR